MSYSHTRGLPMYLRTSYGRTRERPVCVWLQICKFVHNCGIVHIVWELLFVSCCCKQVKLRRGPFLYGFQTPAKPTVTLAVKAEGLHENH